ncbi:hypothetical protein [Aestuariibaculum marinum]|uniref:NlpE C-terminal OB domain-containing protein n=1 Tax=Aestuariibaculum marinum TaxID=2683592 RepID=A0A8J6U590_9FLAO|nr:hypothetical protein [Aestuariibaculum marinum]MBD0823559.1 hypothetical protein [Aestuariibaculum marinum]
MKKAFVLLLTLSVLTACKSDKKAETTEETITADSPEKTAKQSDGLTLLKGDFVYFDGAAVIQTHANIYGVFITDKMQELNELAEKYKTEPTDMVPVEIRGKITNKKDDKILWDNKVEVVEILNVSKPNPESNNVVKLGQE